MTSVRQATVHDIDLLAPLFDAYRQFYGQVSDLQRAASFLLERFKHHESVILIASSASGEAVGFVQLYPSFSSVRTARTYVLNDLYVSTNARNAGVAKELLKEAARLARALGAIRLTLSTAHTNEPAQNLYQALGWKLDQQFRSYALSLESP